MHIFVQFQQFRPFRKWIWSNYFEWLHKIGNKKIRPTQPIEEEWRRGGTNLALINWHKSTQQFHKIGTWFGRFLKYSKMVFGQFLTSSICCSVRERASWNAANESLWKSANSLQIWPELIGLNSLNILTQFLHFPRDHRRPIHFGWRSIALWRRIRPFGGHQPILSREYGQKGFLNWNSIFVILPNSHYFWTALARVRPPIGHC